MGMKTEDMMKLIKLNTKTDVSGKIELQLNVNAPAGVDTKQLEIALKDGAIQQQVMKMIAASNGDIFSGIKK